MNTYGYVGGNALRLTDPTGENPAVGCLAGSWGGPIGCGVGAAIGGFVGAVATLAILSTPGDTTKADSKADKQCPTDDPCGSLTRVQAFQLAQQIAQVSRKERYYIPFSDLNRTSRGSCYAGLISHGAQYLGFGCGWQKVKIEDHPDGHAHMPGGHHDCPHIHVYKDGQSVAEITYKRGVF